VGSLHSKEQLNEARLLEFAGHGNFDKDRRRVVRDVAIFQSG